MRVAALALVALAATGCTGPTETGGVSGQGRRETKLTIEISIRGSEAPTKVWTLTCPDGGTLPHPDRACRKLAKLSRPFAPTPKTTACTQVYGGPEIADVSGSFRGRPVHADFDKGNGCEIERWNRVAFLFPTS